MKRAVSVSVLALLSMLCVWMLGASTAVAAATNRYVLIAGEYRMEIPATEDNVAVIGDWYLHLDPFLQIGAYQLRSKSLRVDAIGYFEINLDRIIFYDDRCLSPIDQQPIPGTYTWQVNGGGALTFNEIKDTCPYSRSQILTRHTWVRELYRVVK